VGGVAVVDFGDLVETAFVERGEEGIEELAAAGEFLGVAAAGPE
jgi:hypothetical protein